MNITHHWKRFLAVGCSHGYLSDGDALEAVLRFKRLWKPHTVIHLGDCFDTTAFMKDGAAAGQGGPKPIKPDLDSGHEFLRQLRPNVFCCGNHEDRLWRLASHRNEIVATLAQSIITGIQTICDGMGCEILPWEYKQAFHIGNFKFFHGTIFTESCARDTAEARGNCVFAHAHRASMATGRRDDCPTGICVGHLMREDLADYAKARKSTYAWSRGFCWGVYHQDRLVPWLHVQPQGQKEWVLPI